MPVSEDAWKVITAFQRFIKSGNKEEIDNFSLPELHNADQQLGNRDVSADFRLALKNRITELEQKDQRQHEGKIRAWQIIVGIIIGLVVVGLAKLLFGT